MKILSSSLPNGIKTMNGEVFYDGRSTLGAICEETGRATIFIVEGNPKEGLFLKECRCNARTPNGNCNVMNGRKCCF